MKNLSLGLNILLLVAVAILFYLQLSGGKTSSNEQQNKLTQGSGVKGNIAYVDIDSLQFYYDYFDDMKAELETNSNKIQKDLIAREQKLQQKMVSFQRQVQAGLISQAKGEKTQRQLMTEGEEYQRYKESVLLGLQEKQKVSNDSLYKRITRYLEVYNKDKNFEYIMGWSEGSAILYANKGFDITKEVVDGLNLEYRKEKEALNSESNK